MKKNQRCSKDKIHQLNQIQAQGQIKEANHDRTPSTLLSQIIENSTLIWRFKLEDMSISAQLISK